ncbi:hypothetical protein HYW17_05290 [Candidatus Uhrbacteria bacterium]|nr:hypothetical protein [Candidatus Uhrbacteria bacterium]
MEAVEPMPAPTHRYDPVTQCEEGGELFAGTMKSQSFQNSTTSYSGLTGYEDYDDQYVTRND